METTPSKLIGTWKSDRADAVGISEYGEVTLTFRANGELIYTIHDADVHQVIRMTYRVEPGFIITDQPSKPGEKRSAYKIERDGKLSLRFGNIESKYTRVGP